MTLPPDFISRTQVLLGDNFAHLETALKSVPPVSIRINPEKSIARPDAEPVTWSKTGYYLPERLSFTFDPLFHAGVYYVQEASSMFLEQVIRTHVKEPVKCLDLCAAPGGKSTHLPTLLPKNSLLVSNEVIRSRSHILAENCIKWGKPDTIVTNNDPEEIGNLPHLFDVIVTDVPCSGEGMFRKDPDSIAEWSVANVELCASRQRRIIHDIWPALKPGGLLIYSTCTYNTEENEENIRYFAEEFGAEVLSVPVQKEWNITGALRHNNPVYRFFPHETRGEGFFIAVLRKGEDHRENRQYRSINKKEKGKKTAPVPTNVYDWISNPDTFHLEIQGDIIRAIPFLHLEPYRLINKHLRIVSAGISIGTIKGKDILPDHSLAMSTNLAITAFPSVELSWEEAISFLRKEALVLTSVEHRGYILVTYQNIPIGFVKNIGNRANNLYPQEWRIRSGYMPENINILILPSR